MDIKTFMKNVMTATTITETAALQLAKSKKATLALKTSQVCQSVLLNAEITRLKKEKNAMAFLPFSPPSVLLAVN